MRTVRSPLFALTICSTAMNAAAAGPCGRPDLLETFPEDGAIDVPINARLSAHYAPTAEYVNEEITLEHVGIASEMANATFDSSEGFLSFQPSETLVPGESYVVRWPGLRGINTALAGKSREVHFTAGSSADVDAPLFGGVHAIDWDVERVDDDCTDSLEDRFVFDLDLDDATDDGGRGMLTLVVFQSKGGSAVSSPEPVLVQRFADSANRVRVQRSIDSAAGNVCFAALARDSAGRVSNSADREVCVATVRPPFFYGCAVASARARRATEVERAAGALLIAAIALASVSRRRARRGKSGA